jgi:hypothetical protein
MAQDLSRNGKVSVLTGNEQEELPTSQDGSDSGVRSKLGELVQRFHICWEALPDYYYVHKEKRQIGFTLDLTGTHEQGVEHPLPGCQHCYNVRIALHEIAKWIIPKERRDTDHEILPYDQSIQYNPERKFRSASGYAIGPDLTGRWTRAKCVASMR